VAHSRTRRVRAARIAAAIGAATRELRRPVVRTDATRIAEIARRSQQSYLAFLAEVLIPTLRPESHVAATGGWLRSRRPWTHRAGLRGRRRPRLSRAQTLARPGAPGQVREAMGTSSMPSWPTLGRPLVMSGGQTAAAGPVESNFEDPGRGGVDHHSVEVGRSVAPGLGLPTADTTAVAWSISVSEGSALVGGTSG
jgi:hypothetical protein